VVQAMARPAQGPEDGGAAVAAMASLAVAARAEGIEISDDAMENQQ